MLVYLLSHIKQFKVTCRAFPNPYMFTKYSLLLFTCVLMRSHAFTYCEFNFITWRLNPPPDTLLRGFSHASAQVKRKWNIKSFIMAIIGFIENNVSNGIKIVQPNTTLYHIQVQYRYIFLVHWNKMYTWYTPTFDDTHPRLLTFQFTIIDRVNLSLFTKH